MLQLNGLTSQMLQSGLNNNRLLARRGVLDVIKVDEEGHDSRDASQSRTTDLSLSVRPFLESTTKGLRFRWGFEVWGGFINACA